MLWQRKTSPAFDATKSIVSIFSKPGCHLCEVAKDQLLGLQRQYGFRLEEVDISTDAKLLEEFETRIPLIWVDGHLVCKYRVDEAALVKDLRRAGANAGNQRRE